LGLCVCDAVLFQLLFVRTLPGPGPRALLDLRLKYE
jgi:hypothetical protein